MWVRCGANADAVCSGVEKGIVFCGLGLWVNWSLSNSQLVDSRVRAMRFPTADHSDLLKWFFIDYFYYYIDLLVEKMRNLFDYEFQVISVHLAQRKSKYNQDFDI